MFKIITIVIIICLDQFTKHWAIQKGPCEFLSFLNIVNLWNHGITFGIYQSIPAYIVIGATVLIMLYIVWELRGTKRKLDQIAFSFILGGALGNFIDRIRLGFVVDFLDFHIGTVHYPWPFNIADSFIICGIGLLILSHFLFKHHVRL